MATNEDENETGNSAEINTQAEQTARDRPYPIGGSGEQIGPALVYTTDDPDRRKEYWDVVIGDQLAYCYYREYDQYDDALQCDAWPFHRIDRIEQVNTKRLADE